MASNIKVLVVDDSVVYRELLREGLNKKFGIEVVATAVDPFDAKNKILQYRPNVMVCDIEMPKMNGLTFIKKLLPQYPIPTIMTSSSGNEAFDSIDAGAVDFVAKCVTGTGVGRQEFVDEVAEKIRIAKDSKVVLRKTPSKQPIIDNTSRIRPVSKHVTDLIAIGASTGGTEAIANVLTRLPGELPGIVVVQHIPPMFSNMFAQRINKCTQFTAKEACTGDEIKPGTVLIAPGDKQMKVTKKGGKLIVEVEHGPKVSGHCPSVDVLFHSVAEAVGKNAIGVIMTGMGADGAKGMLEMHEKGARTIGQDQESCVVYGMPKEAYVLGGVSKQASLQNIPKAILEFL